MKSKSGILRARQKLGKYRVQRKLAEGGFAVVYDALDTIEGVHVALKVPRQKYVDRDMLDQFRKEVRLTTRLDHPNILPIKNAEFIDGHFVVVYALGEGTLADRLEKRMTVATALSYIEQTLEAVAHAHDHSVIHCDIKPENLILFPGHRLRLTDFGIARVAARTLVASGSGTVGYLAPEQALGKPSFRSDVFSLGLLFYRMLSGDLPEWPFDWPPPGIDRVRTKVHPDLVALIERALKLDQYRRFADASVMLEAWEALERGGRLLAPARSTRSRRKKNGTRDWKEVREKLFVTRFKRVLDLRHTCSRCHGPVSEPMAACPWCGTRIRVWKGPTRFPARCTRCKRGRKLDWRFCPWCYGPGFRTVAGREYSDRRYVGRCSGSRCSRRVLMPFQRYCPWCRTKVRRKWPLEGSGDRCKSCGWGVVGDFWDWCPWCAKRCAKQQGRRA